MATVNLFFDTRATAEGEGIIKISVTHDRVKRLYTTGIKTTLDHWKDLPKKGERLDKRVKDETRLKLYADIYDQPNGFYRRAETIAEAMGATAPFDFDTFKEQFDSWGVEKKVETEKTDLIKTLSNKAKLLLEKGQISHGTNFGALGKSLERFCNSLTPAERKEYGLAIAKGLKQQSAALEFRHVTPDFLKHYEEYMMHEGKARQSPKSPPTGVSVTTVSIYCRALRTAFNEAIEAQIIDRENYPFSTPKEKNKYQIRGSENIKKALSRANIEAIKAYLPEPDSMEQRAHDIWLFSYFANGMNVADLCRLKYKDVSDKYIYYERIKTKTSNKKKPIVISVAIKDQMRQIMQRWANPNTNKNEYLFPFLTRQMDVKAQKQAIHQLIKMTNKYMKRIGEKLGIEADLNTYAARHSYATNLLRTGTPIGFIQAKLGHKSMSTTESYLAGFEQEQETEFERNL